MIQGVEQKGGAVVTTLPSVGPVIEPVEFIRHGEVVGYNGARVAQLLAQKWPSNRVFSAKLESLRLSVTTPPTRQVAKLE